MKQRGTVGPCRSRSAVGKSGRALFHPLRLALTGRENGPELKLLLPLIGRSRAHCAAGGPEGLRMQISLYNTMSRRHEALQPIDPKNVRMYVCGPDGL